MKFLNIPIKLVCLLFALLYLPGTVFSQTPVLLRSTLGTGGASISAFSDGRKISFPQSIGQSGVTGVYNKKNLELRQGYIQPVFRGKSFDEVFNNNITVYPNPSASVVFVKVHREVTGTIELKIIDLAGKLVYAEKNSVSEIIQVDISYLYRGTYILNIKGDNFQMNFKIIKY